MWNRFLILAAAVVYVGLPCDLAVAQITSLSSDTETKEKTIEDGWIQERTDSLLLQTKEIKVHPQASPRPALKYQFMADHFAQIPGNAALYYIKASAFLEQNSSRDFVRKMHLTAVEKGGKDGKDIGDFPPHIWLNMAPNELPKEEVREYLKALSFQEPLLREGARRDHFDMNRRVKEVDDPIGILLPEIQVMRELSRNQSIRTRFAIAEGRIDDAIEIIGQQFSLARHLGEDGFLVSSLVGVAISSIAWNDALYLIQHADCPNLYWALASMPSPLVDQKKSMAVERQFLYLQLKVLREVDEEIRSEGYWSDFVDRLVDQIGMLTYEMKIDADDPKAARAAIVGYIASGYPGAKKYLIEKQGFDPKRVEEYPTAQVVFLAMTRFYDQWRDEVFKWTGAPYWQARKYISSRKMDERLTEAAKECGWAATPTTMFLPAILASRTAEARLQQQIAILMTIEAVRMYAADNDGKLPETLDQLDVPAPIEPFTGKAISYEFKDGMGIIDGHALPGMRYRMILHPVAK